MDWESRSYNPGPVFRPKPHQMEQADLGLSIVTTSWGGGPEAEKISRQISEAVNAAISVDTDMTMLKEKAAKSVEGSDRLRQSLLAAGQAIFKQNNSKQIRLLVETLLIQRDGSSLYWAQVGQPNLFLVRQGRVAPLVFQSDHSVRDPSLAPLPTIGLGLDSQTTIQTGNVRVEKGDQLILLAQSWMPSWPRWSKNPTFRELTSALIDDQPDLAFWCALTNL